MTLKEKLEIFFYSYDHRNNNREAIVMPDFNAIVEVWYAIFVLLLPFAIPLVLFLSFKFNPEVVITHWFVINTLYILMPPVVRFFGLWIQLCIETYEKLKNLYRFC